MPRRPGPQAGRRAATATVDQVTDAGTSLSGDQSNVLPVSGRIAIPRSELAMRATRSGGAGGQHVNTSSTRVELTWNVHRTQAVSDELRERLRQRLAGRLDGDGNLRVVASNSRSQRQNREAAERRLAELVRRALVVPRQRVRTSLPRAAKEARLEAKRRQSQKKRLRSARPEE